MAQIPDQPRRSFLPRRRSVPQALTRSSGIDPVPAPDVLTPTESENYASPKKPREPAPSRRAEASSSRLSRMSSTFHRRRSRRLRRHTQTRRFSALSFANESSVHTAPVDIRKNHALLAMTNIRRRAARFFRRAAVSPKKCDECPAEVVSAYFSGAAKDVNFEKSRARWSIEVDGLELGDASWVGAEQNRMPISGRLPDRIVTPRQPRLRQLPCRMAPRIIEHSGNMMTRGSCLPEASDMNRKISTQVKSQSERWAPSDEHESLVTLKRALPDSLHSSTAGYTKQKEQPFDLEQKREGDGREMGQLGAEKGESSSSSPRENEHSVIHSCLTKGSEAAKDAFCPVSEHLSVRSPRKDVEEAEEPSTKIYQVSNSVKNESEIYKNNALPFCNELPEKKSMSSRGSGFLIEFKALDPSEESHEMFTPFTEARAFWQDIENQYHLESF